MTPRLEKPGTRITVPDEMPRGGARKGAGRPKLDAKERLVPIEVRLHPTTLKKLDRLAKSQEKSRSELIRELVERRVSRT